MADDARVELAVEREWFVDPNAVRIDQELDLTRWVAINGLVDAHAHLAADGVNAMVGAPIDHELGALRSRARAQLSSGVMTVVDKGAKSDGHLALLAEPPTDVPDLHMSGTMISAPGGYYDGFGAQVGPADLGETVAARCDTPASWVKLVGDWPRKGEGVLANFTEEGLREVVRIAHGRGRKVAVHTMGRQMPAMAVQAGVDSIEHGLFLTIEDLELLAATGGHWVPTVVAMEATMESLRPGSSGAEMIGSGLENVRALLPAAVEMGVTILTGTDLVLGHGQVAAEAVRLVDYGMTPRDAVRAATRRDAFGDVNGLSEGRPADLVLVPGDPAGDIGHLLGPVGVMRRGRWVRKP